MANRVVTEMSVEEHKIKFYLQVCFHAEKSPREVNQCFVESICANTNKEGFTHSWGAGFFCAFRCRIASRRYALNHGGPSKTVSVLS